MAVTLPCTSGQVVKPAGVWAMGTSGGFIAEGSEEIPALPAGNYFIGYWIDGPQSVAESNENNNIWYWSNVPIEVWNGEAVNWRVDYGNNWNKSGTITKPGATRVRVRFSQIRT